MTENGTLSRIEFTTDTAAQWLGIPSQEMRITAKKLGLTAPYTEADLQQIKADLTHTAPQDQGDLVPTGERFEDAIAPLDDESPNALYAAARAALKRALVQRLKADYNTIESEAIGEILGNV